MAKTKSQEIKQLQEIFESVSFGYDKAAFIVELAQLMEEGGKVDINKYCAICDLVANYFIPDSAEYDNESLEEKRKSYNKGWLDSQKHLFEFVEWVALQNLKLYQEGWCEPGGSNGQHLSTAQVFSLYWNYKNKKDDRDRA